MYVKGAFEDVVQEETEEDRKTQFLKNNADKLLVVNSFNRNKWSLSMHNRYRSIIITSISIITV